MITDILHLIGAATIALGTIHESDGVQRHTFWLRNDGRQTVTLQQGYTSCGCTTIEFEAGKSIAPGDSASVTLQFNPRGKSGDFYESAMLKYLPEGKVQMALEGECVPSASSLLRQYPITVSDNLRISKARFDIGIMRVGASRTLHVGALHLDQKNRVETIDIPFTVTAEMPKGLQHIERVVKVKDGKRDATFKVILDVVIK